MTETTDQDGMTQQEAQALRVATQVRRHVSEQIERAVEPLRQEIEELRTRVADLEAGRDEGDTQRIR
ncbi:MAG TPA: hypothetical protein VGT61_12025 [Thermomicrobiales bacterium]|jgi:tryptophanyl-tRNA synthetase|nr:hypothetical protein [Thermomicrobiales bacterium]